MSPFSTSVFNEDTSNKDASTSTYNVWHRIVGHPNSRIVTQVLQSCNMFIEISNSICNACQLGKSHKMPFPSSSTVYSKPLELLVSDLWGPSSTISSNGFRYDVMFVDAFTNLHGSTSLNQNRTYTPFIHFKTLSFNYILNFSPFSLTGEENSEA